MWILISPARSLELRTFALTHALCAERFRGFVEARSAVQYGVKSEQDAI